MQSGKEELTAKVGNGVGISGMRMQEQLLRVRMLTAAFCAIVLAVILTSIPEAGCFPSGAAFFLAGGLLGAGFAARGK